MSARSRVSDTWPTSFSSSSRSGVATLSSIARPVGRDARGDDAPILRAPHPGHESHPLEAVEQPRRVGHRGHQPGLDVAARQAVRPRPAEDAEHVVLGGGEAVGTQQLRQPEFQQRGRPLDAQHRLLHRRGEGTGLLQFTCELAHGWILCVVTLNVKDSSIKRRLSAMATSATTPLGRRTAGLLPGVATPEGDGILVYRPFPSHAAREIDPFLLLDRLGPVTLVPGAASGVPPAPARRLRGRELHPAGPARASRLPRTPRQPRSGRRPVDDGRLRDHPLRDAGRGTPGEWRHARSHPALGQPPGARQAHGAALRRHPGRAVAHRHLDGPTGLRACHRRRGAGRARRASRSARPSPTSTGRWSPAPRFTSRCPTAPRRWPTSSRERPGSAPMRAWHHATNWCGSRIATAR